MFPTVKVSSSLAAGFDAYVFVARLQVHLEEALYSPAWFALQQGQESLATVTLLAKKSVMASDAKEDNAFVGFWRSTGIFETSMPKSIRIGDMRWGMAHRAIQLAILVVMLISMFSTYSYERLYPVTGSISEAYFDRIGIAQQMKVASKQAYCSTPYAFNYEYCDKTVTTGTFNEFWCEDAIKCEFIDPAFSTFKQTPTDIWVFSYVKRRSTRRVDCAAGSGACVGDEMFEALGERCQCVVTRNSFIAGAEGGKFDFRHRASVDVPITSESKNKLYAVPTSLYAQVRLTSQAPHV